MFSCHFGYETDRRPTRRGPSLRFHAASPAHPSEAHPTEKCEEPVFLCLQRSMIVALNADKTRTKMGKMQTKRGFCMKKRGLNADKHGLNADKTRTVHLVCGFYRSTTSFLVGLSLSRISAGGLWVRLEASF